MLKGMLVKHDGSHEFIDDAQGATIIKDEIEYKASALLYHPKTGVASLRIMVPIMADSATCQFKVLDGQRVDVRQKVSPDDYLFREAFNGLGITYRFKL